MLGHGGVASEVVFAHEHGHRARIASQEHGFLGRGESAAHHEHVFAGEELAVACGAVGHTTAGVFPLAREPDLARRCAHREHDGEALHVTARGMHGFDVALRVDAGHSAHAQFGAEILRLLAHRGGEFAPVGHRYARVVHHFGCDGDLSAEIRLFDDERAVACARQVHAGSQACRAAADDDGVIHIRLWGGHIYQSSPTRSRLGLIVSSPGSHLAGQT